MMSEKDAIIARLSAALPDLRRRWPIRSLALFGSVVRDEARTESDLDLLVEFDRPIDLFAFLALEEELACLAGRRVDLVSRAALIRV
jgi:predicted nucleotidyltransferase